MSKRKKKPACCPECGSAGVVPIVYGYPSPELSKKAEKGEVALGGCCVEDGIPEWICGACGHAWGALRL